jgi:hypothetical protein
MKTQIDQSANLTKRSTVMKRKNLFQTILATLVALFVVTSALLAQGNFTQAGTITNTSGTLKIKGTASFGTNGGTNSIDGTTEYYGGSAGTPQTVVAYGYNNLVLSGTTTVNKKQFAVGNPKIGGNFTLGGTLASVDIDARTNATTIEFNGTGAQNVTPILYNNLTFSNGGSRVFLAGTTQINGNFAVTGGSVDATTSNTTIEFDGAGSQNIAAFPYNNLTVDTRAAGTVTFSPSATIAIKGAFSPAALTGTGSYVSTGTTFDFNGTGAQTISVFAFNNLTISQARGGTTLVLASGEVGVAGTFSVTASGVGAWTNTGNTVNFNGGNQSISTFANFNGLKFDAPDATPYTKTATGDLTASGALTVNLSTVTVDMSTHNLSFGSATNNGTVQFASATFGKPVGSGAGIVEYNGAIAQTVGIGTYYNLTFTNGAAGAQKSIAGLVTANHNVVVNASGYLTVSGTLNANNDMTNNGALTNTGTIQVGN